MLQNQQELFTSMCDIEVIAWVNWHLDQRGRLWMLYWFSLLGRMHAVGLALEELLVTAQKQDCLTVGIYESAKHLNT